MNFVNAIGFFNFMNFKNHLVFVNSMNLISSMNSADVLSIIELWLKFWARQPLNGKKD